MANIKYMDEAEPLLFVDMFHEVWVVIKAFNEHYAREYSLGWLNCLDKLMNSWLNKLCPGFMICPQKPSWPFGNEYHPIMDGNKNDHHLIMWHI